MEKMLGVMLDCSRNAVMKPETVKHYANIVKKMGYNTAEEFQKRLLEEMGAGGDDLL